MHYERLWWVYREAGLHLKRKRRRHCVRVGSPRPAPTGANQEWALGFAHDVIAHGRNIRVLSVVCAFTWECLAPEVDAGFAGRARDADAGPDHRRDAVVPGRLAVTTARN